MRDIHRIHKHVEVTQLFRVITSRKVVLWIIRSHYIKYPPAAAIQRTQKERRCKGASNNGPSVTMTAEETRLYDLISLRVPRGRENSWIFTGRVVAMAIEYAAPPSIILFTKRRSFLLSQRHLHTLSQLPPCLIFSAIATRIVNSHLYFLSSLNYPNSFSHSTILSALFLFSY